VPITPTIPQQSVVTDAESDATSAVVATSAAANKVAALVDIHREEFSDSEDAKDDSVEIARKYGTFAEDADLRSK
jgi:hypothetical protein